MSTTHLTPQTADEDEIPFAIKVGLPCSAAGLLIFFGLFLSIRCCIRRRYCCRDTNGQAMEHRRKFVVMEPSGRAVCYPQHPPINNFSTPPELPNSLRYGSGIEGFEDFDHSCGRNHQPWNGHTGVMDRQEPRQFDPMDTLREYHSNIQEHPPVCGLRNCDSALVDLYPRPAARRKSDGEVEVFKPGQKGYITMSSINSRPQFSCRPKTGYITPRPEHRKPVNVCLPISKRIEPVNTPEEAQQESYPSTSDENQFQVENPIYERLDRHYRPSRRVESCPSSRHQTMRTHREHYDSLPLLPLELSAVEIPIGPFVSSDKADRNLSETEDLIKHRKSFENMFDGAWWHSDSDTEDDPPRVPNKQLRNNNTCLPSGKEPKKERPTSYVTMNHKNRHARDCRTCDIGAISSAAATLPHNFQANHDSYMTHGQMMRGRKLRGEEDTPTSNENNSHSLPPLPAPCAQSRVYINVCNGSDMDIR